MKILCRRRHVERPQKTTHTHTHSQSLNRCLFVVFLSVIFLFSVFTSGFYSLEKFINCNCSLWLSLHFITCRRHRQISAETQRAAGAKLKILARVHVPFLAAILLINFSISAVNAAAQQQLYRRQLTLAWSAARKFSEIFYVLTLMRVMNICTFPFSQVFYLYVCVCRFGLSVPHPVSILLTSLMHLFWHA